MNQFLLEFVDMIEGGAYHEDLSTAFSWHEILKEIDNTNLENKDELAVFKYRLHDSGDCKVLTLRLEENQIDLKLVVDVCDTDLEKINITEEMSGAFLAMLFLADSMKELTICHDVKVSLQHKKERLVLNAVFGIDSDEEFSEFQKCISKIFLNEETEIFLNEEADLKFEYFSYLLNGLFEIPKSKIDEAAQYLVDLCKENTDE